MKKLLISMYFLLICGLLCTHTMNDNTSTTLSTPSVHVIPQPVNVEIHEGIYTVTPETVISVMSAREQEIANYLSRSVKEAMEVHLEVSNQDGSGNNQGIVLAIDETENIPHEEGYKLEIGENGTKITALSEPGLFYGVQTFLQILSPWYKGENELTLPHVTILDYPRFDWRGMHLDVCRHFYPPDFIKKMLDVMAMHKLNVFHWHLTEDQAWRIEIKQYPKLTEIGAWRDGIGFELDPADSIYYNEKGQYGGYFTQDEIRDIIEYAKARHITIVPEIEMPGHAMAALTAYPELSCTGGPFEIPLHAGIFEDVFCAGKDETFEFLKNVLTEVIDLFPGEYVHIGGDECPKTRWEECPDCQKRMVENDLECEYELQSYFIRRMEKFLENKGKRLIGWDEILEGGLDPSATVMSWRRHTPGIKAAKAGHDVVMSPFTHCYFDYYQWHDVEPRAIGGLITLERAYEFEPVPDEIPEEKRHHVLGGQCNIWTEYMPNEDSVMYMALPRLCALAETVWSPAEERDWLSFSQRIITHLPGLTQKGLHYRIPGGITIEEEEPGMIIMTPELPETAIYYTTDGSEPGKHSHLYTEPLSLKESTLIRSRVILPDGTRGNVFDYMTNRPAFTMETNMHHFAHDVPRKIFDGFKDTYFQSRWAAGDDSYLTLFFDEPYRCRKIIVFSGDARGFGSLKNAVLEVSGDGESFEVLTPFKNGIALAEVKNTVKAIRISVTESQSERMIIRELVLK